MALSKRTKDIMIVAMADKKAANELADAVAAGSNPQATSVAALGALADVGFVDVADVGPADLALAADVDARISSVQGKIDAVIAALKAAGLMA